MWYKNPAIFLPPIVLSPARARLPKALATASDTDQWQFEPEVAMQKKVMVIDDSPLVTRMISSYLSLRGYEVETANSSFGFLNRLKEFTPHVLLIDLGLPTLRGDAIARLIKEKGESLLTRIIIISSEAEVELRQVVASGLADAYFVKGNPLQELEEKVAAQLRACR